MQDIYVYLILGIILGVGITMFIYETYKEWIYNSTTRYMSKRMLHVLIKSKETMMEKIIEVKRDLTDEEKDKIIEECYNNQK